MMASTLDDAKTYDENIDAFGKVLEGLDTTLGPVLSKHLSNLAAGSDKDTILDALIGALEAPEAKA